MATKTAKWGNSVAVRIPDDIVEDIGLKPGREVTVKNVRNTVVIAPILWKKKRRTLAELVSRIKPGQLHEGIDWGDPVGKEIW